MIVGPLRNAASDAATGIAWKLTLDLQFSPPSILDEAEAAWHTAA